MKRISRIVKDGAGTINKKNAVSNHKNSDRNEKNKNLE